LTNIEILTLALSGIALVVALMALSRASTAITAREQLEQFIKGKQQTDIQVLFLKTRAGHYNFTLSNRGSSEARNINLELVDDIPEPRNPLTSGRDQLPVPQLDPAGFFQVPAEVIEGTPTHFTVKLTWNNADGSQSVKDVPVNLIE
jgi:hypothetical protein